MCGINYYNKDVLRSSTLRGYATAVNTLFQLRGCKQPTELSNPSNMPGIIVNNLTKEETVASQQSPLDSTIFVGLNTQHSHICADNLAHPKESSKRSEDQAFYRYKEPCNMPCTGSTANGYESQPSWTTGRHAGCLL
jgi:hypothetical protein